MEYWYLWVIFAVLCVLTGFALVKANGAARQHNKEKERILKELERLKALKAEFSAFDASKAENTDARTLLDGVCAVIQAKTERESDAESAFSALSLPQKYAYTLNCIIEDCEGEGLSCFFEKNTEPLLSLVQPALQAIGEEALAENAGTLFAMFDNGNDAAVFDSEKTEKADRLFLSVFETDTFLNEIKQYIVQNTAYFQ